MADTKVGIDIEAIRERAAVASPGPWFWHGNTDVQHVYLAGRWPGHGTTVVMDFWRWGMQRAQPGFYRFDRDNKITTAKELPVYQVCPEATDRTDRRVYRADIVGLRHPNAEFIAHARQDIDDLLAYIDELEAEVKP